MKDIISDVEDSNVTKSSEENREIICFPSKEGEGTNITEECDIVDKDANKPSNRGGKTAPKSVFSINPGATSAKTDDDVPAKHKGIRPRGCPCCDPEELDNILDAMMNPI